MMKQITVVFLFALCLASGCTTPLNQRMTTESRKEIEIENMRMEVLRLQERVEGFAAAQQRLYEDIDGVRRDLDRLRGSTQDRTAALEDAVRTLQGISGRLRGEIVEDITKRLGGSLRAPGPGPRVEHGREHEVRPGETLSEIAAAYGVSVKRIVDANRLQDPNAVRAGQKLFIPE